MAFYLSMLDYMCVYVHCIASSPGSKDWVAGEGRLFECGFIPLVGMF